MSDNLPVINLMLNAIFGFQYDKIETMKKIGILGSGTWGTALANMLALHDHDVTLYSTFKEETESYIRTRRHPHLDCDLSEKIKFTNNVAECCVGKDIVIFASPSLYIRATAMKVKSFLSKETILVTVAKGIEPDTLFFMSEVIEDVVGQGYRIVALSGPTHAEEVAICLPTLIVSASSDEEAALIVQQTFSNETLRVYTNYDIKGVELCGALKNIVALAAGMSEGLGYGDNAKAAIITRGLAEITRLGKAMNCDERTFSGLAGVGDIVVTATSLHSRNHNAGVMLGQGFSLQETLKKIGMVVEGVNALEAAKQLEIKYNVELPIIDAAFAVVHSMIPVEEVLPLLFCRKPRSETKKK